MPRRTEDQAKERKPLEALIREHRPSQKAEPPLLSPPRFDYNGGRFPTRPYPYPTTPRVKPELPDPPAGYVPLKEAVLALFRGGNAPDPSPRKSD